jgi:hypothetical protein
MRTLWIGILISFSLPALAGELMIFDMRKNLRMSDSDPVYHDYYVNGGTEAGMSTGMIITVTRKLPLYDTYQNHSAGDLLLKVARVKIIATQKGLSVARLQSEFTRENAPLLEDNFIMVGDTLDLSTATSDRKSADSGEGKAESDEPSAKVEPAAPQSKPVAQISVNSVDLSSQAPMAKKPSPEPAPVTNPSLQ